MMFLSAVTRKLVTVPKFTFPLKPVHIHVCLRSATLSSLKLSIEYAAEYAIDMRVLRHVPPHGA